MKRQDLGTAHPPVQHDRRPRETKAGRERGAETGRGAILRHINRTFLLWSAPGHFNLGRTTRVGEEVAPCAANRCPGPSDARARAQEERETC